MTAAVARLHILALADLASVVQLRFKTVHRNLLGMIVDPRTGECLLAEPLAECASWFEAMGYRWIAGSNGLWAKDGR